MPTVAFNEADSVNIVSDESAITEQEAYVGEWA